MAASTWPGTWAAGEAEFLRLEHEMPALTEEAARALAQSVGDVDVHRSLPGRALGDVLAADPVVRCPPDAELLHEPDVLILDEIFYGFDPINIEQIKDVILDLNRQEIHVRPDPQRPDHWQVIAWYDFPAPEAPTIAIRSPRCTVRSIPLRAWIFAPPFLVNIFWSPDT